MMNVERRGRSDHSEGHLRSSSVLLRGSGQSDRKREGEFPGAVSPGLLNTGVPNVPATASTEPYGGISKFILLPGTEEVMSWPLFTAFAAAIASAGFLFVMALTGGIHLG
jgi:hypothetical protein